MTTISFYKINNTFARLTSDDEGALKTMKGHFTFQIPNAHFNPRVKKGGWDGKIRLLKPNGSIYYGLKHEIIRVCDDHGWEFDDHDQIDNTFPTTQDVQEFCESLNLTSDGQSITVRDYQLKYITHALQNGRALLLCPTSGGKSLIAYVIIRWALAHGLKRGLITVPSINLVSQMCSDFVDYGWDRDNMHLIYEGAEKESDCPLTITTWQGVQNEESFFRQFDFMIGDEAHLYKAKSLVHIMESLYDCHLRIGMSGTLDGLTTSKMVIEGLFGTSYRVVKTQDLIEQGYSSEFLIKALVLNYSETLRKHFTELRLDYDKEREFLFQSKKRNEFIARLALNCKGNTMVFFDKVTGHGQLIYETLLRLNTDPNRKIYYIHGKVKVDERERIRHEVETTNNTILVVSYGTTSTGANYKSVHNIIFGSAYKALVRTLQSIGRGLRKSKTKDTCVLYDLADNLSWFENPKSKKMRDNYIMKHFKDRLGIYVNEGFRVKVMELDL